jgi:hypothetical protein
MNAPEPDPVETWLAGFRPAPPRPELRAIVLEACAAERPRGRRLPWDVLAALAALGLALAVALAIGSTARERLDEASGGPPPPTRAERDADELLHQIRIDDANVRMRLVTALAPSSNGHVTPREWATFH